MRLLHLLLALSFGAATVTTYASSRVERLQALVPRLIAQKSSQAYFASASLIVTKKLRAKINRKDFRSNECLQQIIEEFLAMYFEALEKPDQAPEAWRTAFTAKTKPSIHLLLGLNAHITYDLPISMWRVSRKSALCSSSAVEADFFSLNDFFTKIIPELNRELKRTHQRMTGIKSDSLQGVFQKGSLPETIAVHTVAKHVHFLRGDAWKDFEHLEQGTFSKAQFESIRRIREKAFARAEFYKNLKDFAPETGF